MPTKNELLEQADKLGLEVDEDMTKAEIEMKIAEVDVSDDNESQKVSARNARRMNMRLERHDEDEE